MSTDQHFTTLPRLAPRYATALIPRRHRPGTLPDRRLAVDGLRVDQRRLADYSRLCGFGLDGALPVTYPHVLGFALQVRLMSEPDFPLRLPGLVHLRQRIDQRRRIDAGEALDLRVWAEGLRAHPRGAQVDLVTEVTAAGEPRAGEPSWRGRSTYLARGARAEPSPPPASADTAEPEPEPAEVPADRTTARWSLPADLGRRYAQVSGDINPIHLHPLPARLLGFPGAIAPGMWTAARCLATLAGRLPERPTVDVVFRGPLPLPATVELATSAAPEGWDLTLRSADGHRVHLVGAARA